MYTEIPMWKVTVTFGDGTDRITHSKTQYDAAFNLFVDECGNAARVMAKKPNKNVVVLLLNPEGIPHRMVDLTPLSHNHDTGHSNTEG